VAKVLGSSLYRLGTGRLGTVTFDILTQPGFPRAFFLDFLWLGRGNPKRTL
jgi:hypothetical protein